MIAGHLFYWLKRWQVIYDFFFHFNFRDLFPLEGNFLKFYPTKKNSVILTSEHLMIFIQNIVDYVYILGGIYFFF